MHSYVSLVNVWDACVKTEPLTRIWRSGRAGLVIMHSGSSCMSCIHGCLGRIEVCFFLKLANVLFVPDPLVSEPVGYL